MPDTSPTTELTTDGDGIAVLCLRRGPVNALTAGFLEDITARLAEAEADPACRAITLRSDFKVFSAGMDLKAALGFSAEQEQHMARGFTMAFRALYACPKPVVCAVGGAAIAGGFFFPACSDMRIATARATFGLAEVRVGAALPVGPLEIARAELPPADFRRLLLTGQPIDAQAAVSAGLVDRIVDTGALEEAAREAALALAALPATAYAATKADLRRPALEAIDRAIVNGEHAPGKAWFLPDTKDHMERMLS